MRRKNAKTPSMSATSLLNITVANVEPNATVTIKSKAFILDKVLLPEVLNKIIKRTKASTVTIIVRMILSHESKKMFSITDLF
jgi:glucose-6-phosphate-specific signal transduction histidine kinase